MAKTRVYELARDLGIDSKDVLEQALELGLEVKTASSGLDDAEVELVTLALNDDGSGGNGATATAEEPAAEPAGVPEPAPEPEPAPAPVPVAEGAGEGIDSGDVEIAEVQADIAVLAVPAEVCQSVADRLVEAGIRGILNFVPRRLTVPPSVKVHYVDLSIEMETLSYYLRTQD